MSGRFLDGLKVLDFSHMLAGPLAARRLGDFGARVIKIETKQGETLRTLGRESDWVDGDNLYFHAYNAGKESIGLDLKHDADRELAMRLVLGADVVIQSFRPGILTKFGLDYDQIRLKNSGLVYASVSGFGADGPWRADPGQDLIAQARSGIMWLSGAETGAPTPIGTLVSDITTANLLCQGILAALVGRGRTGMGAHVETSLLEATLEMQQDSIPMHLHRRQSLPKRSASGRSGLIFSDPPYGVYETVDGHIAVSALPPTSVRDLLGDSAGVLDEAGSADAKRDRVYDALAAAFAKQTTEHWLAEAAKVGGWVVKVLNWDELLATPNFHALGILTTPQTSRGAVFLRAPMRFDGKRPETGPSPKLDDAGARIRRDGWG